MKRILFYVLFSFFAICGPAYCHTFEAIRVNEKGTEAVLRDKVTGDEWMVRVGDQIDAYRVIRISMEYVTIGHPGKDGVFYITKIPIDRGHQAVKASPE